MPPAAATRSRSRHRQHGRLERRWHRQPGGGTLTLKSSTVSGNAAANDGGIATAGTVTLKTVAAR
jgi:hypothetical protein